MLPAHATEAVVGDGCDRSAAAPATGCRSSAIRQPTPGMAQAPQPGANRRDRPRGETLGSTLRELWTYRELFYFLAWRDVKIRYKQTIFGVLWAIIQPLLTMAIFLVLFSRLAKLPSDDMPHALFYLSALVPWIYFSSTVNSASTSLATNAEMLKKIYFPRLILPMSVGLSNGVDFIVSSLLLLALTLAFSVAMGASVLLWPVLAIALALFAVSVGMILAALDVKYRDVRYVVPFLLQLWMFATPIIYPLNLIPERYRWALAINPLTGIIEGFRHAVAASHPFDPLLLCAALLEVAVLLVIALKVFRGSEKAFADLL
jgi:lipopolysaccharide transport system permease protein